MRVTINGQPAHAMSVVREDNRGERSVSWRLKTAAGDTVVVQLTEDELAEVGWTDRLAGGMNLGR